MASRSRTRRVVGFFGGYLAEKFVDWVLSSTAGQVVMSFIVGLVGGLLSRQVVIAAVVAFVAFGALWGLGRLVYWVDVTAIVERIPEHFAHRRRVLQGAARPSDEGPSHRITLRVLNRGVPGAFYASVVSVSGFAVAPTPPWDCQWRDGAGTREWAVDHKETRVVVVAEADYMDSAPRNTLALAQGAIYFLKPDGTRLRAVLGGQATTPFEFDDLSIRQRLTKAEVVVRIGRARGRAKCGRLLLWFDPSPPAEPSGTYNANEPVMRPEVDWEWTVPCP